MFVCGQRWMSEAEPDNGLGLITETDGRMVTVVFVASSQKRTYSAQNAPLIRVQFAPGDSIEDANGCYLLVESVAEQAGLIRYHCQDTEGNAVVLEEKDLNDRMRLNRPQDKLLTGRVDADIWFNLRYQTWHYQAENWQSPVFGLLGPRVDLIPHQLYIAQEVASRQAPRVLLADEVGLGKTIEAGLIMHRMLLSERVQRVLVVVPEALIHQWLVEMLRRFNLHFSIFNDARFAESKDENPFQAEQHILCSLEFLTSASSIARAALDGQWDLLVVDEAHHLEWSPENASLQYELVEALAGMVPSVLLLTATPEQLGKAGHFARLRLLDPQRFHDYATFLQEEAQYAPIAALAARVLQDEALSEDEQEQLTELLGEVDLSDREGLIRRLVDRHGTGRVLFRNTRQAIKGFPGREVQGYALETPKDYKKHTIDITPETNYPRKWAKIDPRVAWLINQLQVLAPEKVLVICAHAKTVIGLKDHLLEKEAIHVAMFHEGMEIVERDRAAVFFADPEEGAQALICSEIGSEGRNFQFAHHLILFDLPLVPGLLEQRIGRLDRIGQKHTIQIHVPYMQGAASEVLFHWYHEGLNAFNTTCPAGSAVYSELADQLQAAIANPEQTGQLLAQGKALTESINQALETGRDRLLELHSYHPERAKEWVDMIAAADKKDDVKNYISRFWDAFGIEHQPARGCSERVRRGAHMRHEHFPGLPAGGATVTWQRQDALVHEDRHFLTWEHPMVRGAMELLCSTELGSSSAIVCSLEPYKTGTVFLELLFLSECLAPAALEAGRYLPTVCHRILLDVKGNNLADEIPGNTLRGMCLSQNKKLVDTIIKSQAEKLKLLFPIGEQIANTFNQQLIDDALNTMHKELDAEYQRLTALAEVNPNVREDELEQVAARRELLEIHLKDARVRLDAVRVVVIR